MTALSRLFLNQYRRKWELNSLLIMRTIFFQKYNWNNQSLTSSNFHYLLWIASICFTLYFLKHFLHYEMYFIDVTWLLNIFSMSFKGRWDLKRKCFRSLIWLHREQSLRNSLKENKEESDEDELDWKRPMFRFVLMLNSESENML